MSSIVFLRRAVVMGFAAGIACGGSHSNAHSSAAPYDGGGGGTSGGGSSSSGGGNVEADASSSGGESESGVVTSSGPLSIQPTSAEASVGGMVQFKALAGGATDSAVTWSVQEGSAGGSVSSIGQYTAPNTVGTYHVVVTSKSDSTQTATATVAVTLPPGTPPNLQVGVWTNISPPGVLFGQMGNNQVEAAGLAMDPSNPYTLYLCQGGFNTMNFDTLPGGVWKTTDGGNTWSTPQAVDAGNAGNTVTNLDSCVNIAVDPGNPKHLYAADGVRGNTIGFWVSNDGAQSWTRSPGFISVTMQQGIQDSDTYGLAVDPSDFNHVLASYHYGWTTGSTYSNNAGILESKDGANTWVAHQPNSGWGGLGYFIMFLSNPAMNIGDSNTWLLGTQGTGFWRTTDGGNTWKQASTVNMAHEGAYTFYASDGTLYVGGLYTPLRSKDNGATFTPLMIMTSFQGDYTQIYGDGQTLYCQGDGFNNTARPFSTSPETDGTTWSNQSTASGGSTSFTSGPTQMAFDSSHNILYASMHEQGMWALKVR